MPPPLPPNAFYLLSYPRSGNTWLLNSLTLLFDCVGGEAYTQDKLYTEHHGELGEPFNFRCAPRRSPDQPICIKSHADMAAYRQGFPPGPVVYVCRDGRDALLSYYFFCQAYPTLHAEQVSVTSIHGTEVQLSRGGCDPVFRADEFADFLRREAPIWASHVRQARQDPGISFVTYEALKADYIGSLNRIIAYLGLPVAKSCAEVEKVYCSGFSKVFSGNTRDYFRRGQVGDWKNWYQPDDVRLLDQLIGRELQELGFETDSKWADHHQAPPAAT